MSEQEKKWREEFESRRLDIPREYFMKGGTSAYLNDAINEHWHVWQAAKRQDAERIAELENSLVYAKEQLMALTCINAELRAKLDALEKQEPAMTITNGNRVVPCGNRVVSWSQLPEGYNGCLFFDPVPATPAAPKPPTNEGQRNERANHN